jgi:LysM repeat protein
MCHHAATPQSVDVVHQGKYCMLADHVSCPIFLQQASTPSPVPVPLPVPVMQATLPQATRPAARPSKPPVVSIQRPRRRAREILLPLMAVAGIIAIFLAVMLILPTAGQFQQAVNGSSTNTGSGLTQTSTVRAIGVAPLNTSATNPVLQKTPTAPPTATKAATSTRVKATETATQAITATLVTQCGRPPGWVQYSVRAGDSFSSLSRVFNLSIAQLQTANCMGNSTFLYVGQLIFTPWIPPAPLPPTSVPATVVPSDTDVPPTVIPSDTSVPPTTEVPPTIEPTEETPIPTAEAPAGSPAPISTEPPSTP